MILYGISWTLTDLSFFRTFPTGPLEDYASTYAFYGTLPTVISGTSTCLTIASPTSTSSFNSNNGVFTFPSHPPLPVDAQPDTDLSQDPKGWTYFAVGGSTCDDQELLQPLFPDLAVWSCVGALSCAEPAMAQQTALYLTVTSTSHEAGSTTPTVGPATLPPASSSGPAAVPPAPSSGPAALQTALSLAPLFSSQPAPKPASVSQSASVSPPPGVQPASTNQPAQNKQPVPNNSPSLTNTVPKEFPNSGNEPTSNDQPGPINQPISSDQPSSNDQTAPSQPAQNPPSPPSATIVPIAVASTNALGNVVLSTTLAAAIAVLQTSPNNQGQASIFTNFSPLTPNAPVTLIPQAMTSTNAQGSVILATSNAVPIPIVITTTNPQGKKIATTSTKYSLVALNPTASPIAFIPTTITTTNAQGGTSVSTATAAIIPIVASSTNPQGQIVLSSSLLTVAAIASTNVVVSFTNPQGSILSSTTQVPAVILTTTNAQGSQTLTTIPIVPLRSASTAPPPITIGTQVVTPNSQSQYIIGSQTLTPGGVITVSGTPVSLAPSATALVIGTSTQQLVPGATTLPSLTIGTLTVAPNSLSQYIISSQTLTPGGLITLSGTPISLAPSATALMIGSSTIPLGSSIILPPPLTIGSQVFTANSATQYIIGSQTLTPGGAITVLGTKVSLAPGDTAAVVGTSTEGLAPLITAGLGSGLGNGNGNGTVFFTGGARASGIPGLVVWLEGILMLLGLGMLVAL